MQQLLVAAALPLVAGHGMVVDPPTAHALTGNKKLAGTCGYFADTREAGCTHKQAPGEIEYNQGCGCHWYENSTYIPGEPTILDGSPLKTFKNCPIWTNPDNLDKTGSPLGCYGCPGLGPGKGVDVTKYHPWRAPGTAPITSPCGVDGGNPRGCPDGNPGPGGCNNGGYGHGPDGRTSLSNPDVIVTDWESGSIQSIAYGLNANHAGGYAYRLCKWPESGDPMDLTEECFQQGGLNFVGDTHTIEYLDGTADIEIPAMDTTEGTFPAGSMWRRNPIPTCNWLQGGPATKCPLGYQFKPAAKGLGGYGSFNNFQIRDNVQVPNLPAGQYVLSWRWDTEEFAQVWNTCSRIRIVNAAVV